MKRITVVGVGFLSLAVVLSCEAAIATWSFNTTGSDLTAPYDADTGSGQVLAPYGATLLTTDGNPANSLQITAFEALVIRVSGAGYSSFTVSYDAKRAVDGNATWEWSVNGTDYTPLGEQAIGANWANYTADFSGVSQLNGADNVYLRTYPSSAPGQLISYDNFQVSAVPEPINVAFVVFGVVVAGTAVSRRFRGAWVKG